MGYGAFDVALVNDLPLFVDPFLLFDSKDDKYKALHHSITRYLVGSEICMIAFGKQI